MKIFKFLFFTISLSAFFVTNSTASGFNVNASMIITNKDSTFRSPNFITIAEANKILEKPSYLKDSTYKVTNNLVRYTLNYFAVEKDTSSKGRIFFTYEEYKDDVMTKSILQSIKTENEKTTSVTTLPNLGDEAFVAKDKVNYPFVLIRKANKIFKFKIYYVTGDASLSELLKVAGKIVATH